MSTIQGDLAKILTESGWQGENQGVRLKIPLPLYVSFMSSFYLTTLRSYLELADEYDAKTFVESVCRFALRDSGRRLTADPAASLSTVRNPFLLNIIWKLPAGLLTALLPVLWFCYYPHSNAALRFFPNPPGGIFFLLFHLCPLIPHRNIDSGDL